MGGGAASSQQGQEVGPDGAGPRPTRRPSAACYARPYCAILKRVSRRRYDRDYYRILALNLEATEDEIRRAYRQLALQWHPDRNAGSAEAEERFKEISGHTRS